MMEYVAAGEMMANNTKTGGKGDDAKDTATKADVSAVKADLSALKAELKTDLSAVEHRLDQKIDRVAEDVGQLKTDVGNLSKAVADNGSRMDQMERRLDARIKDLFNELAKWGDFIVKKIEIYDRKDVVFPRILDEHGKMLRDHDARLAKLETSA